ncbi:MULTISPECIES: pyrroline-5-carboxylate reductase [Thermomonospora]|uniref:Pyrroline-5-carboxylate reductase n=1 Tax=Thermomonospora curvata (strain ATCC 19995 / DSM 43183 / JCM 3096 / KCTC 9072 / NBRC 15933 / NCIMB 10081 / Henssen B9) TaxID=471852 RepID=D1A4B2_THECD|nr:MULTISPECIES: pyrroline-5-carboxylate reductase [Thermomonospora]ACY99986.1 pyrroline-5-carboxylate reductase [Thermomonospora curvata DSM 43183]PKK12206.1 MAG: pyrroline-5-carboxylate reductase [Thermomonospora sp. CIF 1]
MGRLIAILGAGKMGEALLSGVLRAGRRPSELMVTTRREERGVLLRERYGVEVVTNAEAAKTADTLILSVKPQDMDALLGEIRPHVPPGRLVISMAAGITTSFIEQRLPEGVPVVRVMSNTPVLVDQAMSVVSAGSHAGEEHLKLAEELLSPVGKVLRIPESLQDAATALSGSGPAYFYFLVEAMVDAGILLGMPRAAALEMVIQSAVGAAIMLRDSGEHPVLLREAVTSPGGTTIAAIRELERHGVRAAVLEAIEAARDRGRELAEG